MQTLTTYDGAERQAPVAASRATGLLSVEDLVAAMADRRSQSKAAWAEKLHEMKSLGIDYHPKWAAKAK